MKLNVLSDLHLGFGAFDRPENAADVVVLGTYDLAQDAAQRALADALVATGKPVVAIGLRGPYDAEAAPAISAIRTGSRSIRRATSSSPTRTTTGSRNSTPRGVRSTTPSPAAPHLSATSAEGTVGSVPTRLAAMAVARAPRP